MVAIKYFNRLSGSSA